MITPCGEAWINRSRKWFFSRTSERSCLSCVIIRLNTSISWFASRLRDRAQAARKILLPEQVDSAEKQLIRPYEFSVQPDEQQQYNQGPGFCTPEQQRLFGQRKHPERGRRTGSRDC